MKQISTLRNGRFAVPQNLKKRIVALAAARVGADGHGDLVEGDDAAAYDDTLTRVDATTDDGTLTCVEVGGDAGGDDGCCRKH